MPGWKFHVAHSISTKEKAFEVHKALDSDPLEIFSHQKWRKVTHKLPVAIMIGYSTNGMEGARDALRHVLDDKIYYSIFTKREEKEE